MRDEEFAALGLQPPAFRNDPPVGPRDVNGILEAAVAANPEGEALVDGRQRMTFAQVGACVEAAARLMEQAGVGSGDRVAASLGNVNGLVIAFFAVMRLGAVWVGLNRILPADDKGHILSHCGARLLLVDSSLAAEAARLRKRLPDLSAIWVIDDPAADAGWAAALTSMQEGLSPRPPVDPFAPAAIMYTSGTTGAPKGVVHSQHNMVVVAGGCSTHGLVAPRARRGSALPLTITNVMILGPVFAFWNGRAFISGSTTKIGPLLEWLHKEKIGQISFVPTMIYDLLQTDLDLPQGIFVGSGGAPLPEEIREAFFRRYGFHVGTSYGLTEAPTVVAMSNEDPAPEGASGEPLPYLEVTVRDAEGRFLPAGEVGEVCFAACRSGEWADVYTPPLGYWREPEKTAALLRNGIVHSGDHGKLDVDGWLTIADRSSELILRGGSNVYPAEIERVLHTHDGVADCAVVGKADLRMGMLTVACVQLAKPDCDTERLREELHAMCTARLVRYKVPDEWCFMEAFPRNAMGKVIKPRLRELVVQG